MEQFGKRKKMNDDNAESSAISRGCFAYKGKRKQLKIENYLDLTEKGGGSKDGVSPALMEPEFARGKWLLARKTALRSLLARLSTEGETKLKKEMHSKLFGAVCEFIAEQASNFQADEIDAGNHELFRC